MRLNLMEAGPGLLLEAWPPLVAVAAACPDIPTWLIVVGAKFGLFGLCFAAQERPA